MYDIGGLIRGLETVLEPEQIESLKKDLGLMAQEIDRDEFHNLELAASAFGGAETGVELGTHHGRAQQVIAETLEGVATDLREFRTGLIRAQLMLDTADTTAQGDLSRHEAAVAALQDANRQFDSDQRYHQARNEHGGDR